MPGLPRPARRARQGDDGASMIGILLVVVVLGVLAAVTLSTTLGTSPSTTTTGGGGVASTTTSAPASVGAGANEATLASCEANYVIVEQALALYRTAHAADPPAGTRWATTSLDGGPLLQSWPAATTYAIAWTGSNLDVVPAKGVSSRGNYGAPTPPTGCYAASR